MVSYGQKLVIGSKMPELKGVEWLSPLNKGDKALFVVFYQSTSPSSARELLELDGIYTKYGAKIQILILTREQSLSIDLLVSQYGKKYAIGYDSSGSAFETLGVKFLPFAMLFNSKKELYWQGNLTNISPDTLQQVR